MTLPIMREHEKPMTQQVGNGDSVSDKQRRKTSHLLVVKLSIQNKILYLKFQFEV